LLPEKLVESPIKVLRDLQAEGITRGDANPWSKDAFLENVRDQSGK
jgi:antitoxin ParD1/3/4